MGRKPPFERTPTIDALESVIRERQQGYYRALAESNTAGSSERFVTFMLQVIRDALLPFSLPETQKESRARRASRTSRLTPRGRLRSSPTFSAAPSAL